MRKQIAVDLAKSVYQVAESVRAGQVSQRKRLIREAFRRYIQEQAVPVEWRMDACGTAHFWGRFAQALGSRMTAGQCGITSGASAATGRADSPLDGEPVKLGGDFQEVVVNKDTVGAGQSCGGTGPIEILTLVIA